LAQSQRQLRTTLHRRLALYRLAVIQRLGNHRSSDRPLLHLGSLQCWGRRHSLHFQGTMRVRSYSGQLGILVRYRWCQHHICLRHLPAAVSCRRWLHLQRLPPKNHNRAVQLLRHRHQVNHLQRSQVLLQRLPHPPVNHQVDCHRRRMNCRHLPHLQISQKTCKRWSGILLVGMMQQRHRTPQAHN